MDSGSNRYDPNGDVWVSDVVNDLSIVRDAIVVPVTSRPGQCRPVATLAVI